MVTEAESDARLRDLLPPGVDLDLLRLAVEDPNATTPRLDGEHLTDWQLRTVLSALAAQPAPEAVDAETLAVNIEAARNEHWQRHLRDHPLSNAKSCPGDYAAHDAYAHAARIVRASGVVVPAQPNERSLP